MFAYLEQILISYTGQIHLAIFSPVVSFIEEVVPPIPSPSVMIATGAMAQVQGYAFYGLLILTLLGAIGKTFGAIVAYFIANKIEDLMSGKIAKFFGVTSEQIQSFGSRLGKGAWDYIILIVLRSLPIVPSSILSVGCGLLKVRFRLFVISTFLGSLIRDFIYIYLGYVGTTAFHKIFIAKTNSLESTIQIIAVLAIIIFLAYLYFRRGKAKTE
jgi:membrane protein DedA with SNARE-associated domain